MDEVKILMAKEFCLPVARDELPGIRANLVVEESEPEVQILKKLVKQNTTEIEALLDAIASSGKKNFNPNRCCQRVEPVKGRTR